MLVAEVYGKNSMFVYMFYFCRAQLSWEDQMTDFSGFELQVELKRRPQISFPGVATHNIVSRKL